jgi:hypothetical protein
MAFATAPNHQDSPPRHQRSSSTPSRFHFRDLVYEIRGPGLIILFPNNSVRTCLSGNTFKDPRGECWTVVGGMAEALIVAAIPGAIGILLFRRQGDPANARTTNLCLKSRVFGKFAHLSGVPVPNLLKIRFCGNYRTRLPITPFSSRTVDKSVQGTSFTRIRSRLIC